MIWWLAGIAGAVAVAVIVRAVVVSNRKRARLAAAYADAFAIRPYRGSLDNPRYAGLPPWPPPPPLPTPVPRAAPPGRPQRRLTPVPAGASEPFHVPVYVSEPVPAAPADDFAGGGGSFGGGGASGDFAGGGDAGGSSGGDAGGGGGDPW